MEGLLGYLAEEWGVRVHSVTVGDVLVYGDYMHLGEGEGVRRRRGETSSCHLKGNHRVEIEVFALMLLMQSCYGHTAR